MAATSRSGCTTGTATGYWRGTRCFREPAGRPRDRDQEFEEPDGEYQFDNWTADGFRGIDNNRDNRITADEWHFDRESFGRADHNRDGVISRSEFLNEQPGQDDDRGRENRFAELDTNRDNRVSRAEFRDSRANFDLLDDNRDGMISRSEFLNEQQGQDDDRGQDNRFAELDTNRDNRVSRAEWRDSRANFDLLDDNRDGVLTRAEVFGAAPPEIASPAWMSTATERSRATSGNRRWAASVAWIRTATDGCPARNSPDRWWERRE